jgi:uncharacterized repeat protein (TIGR01451 family)
MIFIGGTHMLMWRKVLSSLFTLALLAICVGLPSHNVTAQATRKYAYLIQPRSSDPLRIDIIDPAVPGVLAESRPFPLADNQQLQPRSRRRIVSNPRGDWAAFIISNIEDDIYQSTNFVRLVNLTTQETRDIIRGSIIDNLTWSPDGNYLAIERLELNKRTIWIYSLRDNSLASLFEHSFIRFDEAVDFGWSVDSTKLAIYFSRCLVPNSVCATTIVVYVVGSRTLEKSLDLLAITPRGTVACQLVWSSDGRYIAFFNGCFQQASLSFQEVFIWDLQNNATRQVTNFTGDFLNQPGLSHRDTAVASYSLLWADNQTLLIGADFFTGKEGTFPSEPIAQIRTLAYNVQTSTTQVLSSNERIFNWQRSPAGTDIAYQRFTTVPVYGTSSGQQLKVARYQGGVLVERFSRPAGCDLTWSPNGALLAFSEPATDQSSETACLDATQAFTFYNATDGSTQRFPVSLSGDVFFVEPIGWITGNNNPLPGPLSLAAVCSVNPSAYRVWQVQNSALTPREFQWEVDAFVPSQNGFAIVPASLGTRPGQVFLSVPYTGEAMTMSLFADGKVQASQPTIAQQCPTQPAPQPPLQLAALCTPASTEYRAWRVRNPSTTAVNFAWEVLSTSQRGSGNVPAAMSGIAGETTFITRTDPAANIVRLTVNGVQQDEKSSGATACGTANLGAMMSVSNANPAVGETILISLSYSNTGPDTATSVQASFPVPPGVTLLSTVGSGTYNAATGIWTIGNVANRGRGTIALQVRVNSGTVGQTITASSEVSSATFDPDTANNRASTSFTVR